MVGQRLCHLLLALPGATWAADGSTFGPTFNCAQASGEVEQLICAEPALAALDRQLAQVFKAALAQARDQPAALLHAEQRGWVKGRNDCWKARSGTTWITATWTVDTVRACTEAQYRVRIAELQAVWRLLPPRSVTYTCGRNPADEFIGHFFATEPPTLRAERGDRTVTLWQVGPGPGPAGRYEGRNITVLHQGPSVQVSWLDTNTGQTDALACTAP